MHADSMLMLVDVYILDHDMHADSMLIDHAG